MKALVCEAYGQVDDLNYRDIEDPAPGPDDILVAVKGIGVNFPDGLLVEGKYQFQPECPFAPGTAHHALRQRGQLKAGETLVVLGAAGGTGTAAVQIGKAIGAKVIAVCSSDEKLAFAKEQGADIGINYSNEDLKAAIKKHTDGRGADVVYDVVGGDAFDICSRAMAWNGRLLVVGFASGRIPELPVNLTLVKGYSVVGVFWGQFTQNEPEVHAANMRELFTWVKDGTVSPIIDSVYPLSKGIDAIKYVTGRNVMGKVIIKPDEEIS